MQRLEQVFALCALKPTAKTCPAIKGILEEGEEDMKEAKDPDVLDAGMIADAQAVEHYEIARYGTMIAWANQLGMNEAARLLQQTLEQEYNADKHLTKLTEFGPEPPGRLAPSNSGMPKDEAAWVARLALLHFGQDSCGLDPCGRRPPRLGSARRWPPEFHAILGDDYGIGCPHARTG